MVEKLRVSEINHGLLTLFGEVVEGESVGTAELKARGVPALDLSSSLAKSGDCAHVEVTPVAEGVIQTEVGRMLLLVDGQEVWFRVEVELAGGVGEYVELVALVVLAGDVAAVGQVVLYQFPFEIIEKYWQIV